MIIKTLNNKKIRFHILWSLVFSFLLVSCKENKKEDRQVSIEWEANKAIAIIVPDELLNGIHPDAARKLLRVQLENTEADMLGNSFSTIDAVIFRPIVAFTRGLKYDVYISDKLITSLTIPVDEKGKPPVVSSIYPSGSDVPENLLKMYILFSKPMQEGHALENIMMIRSVKDTVPVFLDLQQELWNKERTILTLWLDPGRIKRGLQPNEKEGAPLLRGQNYRLVITPGWRDTEGLALHTVYSRTLAVRERDSISPSLGQWELILPTAGSREPVGIKLDEQLDYLLLINTIRIIDNNGKSIDGIIDTEANETILSFNPAAAWNAGNYTLEVEARLEDLAGNNLNRLFDRDISKKDNNESKEIYRRPFNIR